ncbi:MAG TPA: mannitol dehydrogenase family protein [Solirubrobacteraceae bacterium]|nr:mannitol dehydrogenase family protein [Solirubrobacteraceae bacterium]
MTGVATARLSRRGLGGRAVVPAAAPAQAGIVHLGLGSFHRAHQAVYTARALDGDGGPWGIVGVASRSRRIADALRAQDGLYCVLELGGADAVPLVVGVHTELLVAADDPAAVVARLADPATRVATLTVTERGYTARATGRLDAGDPHVRADLGGAPPSTTIGLLARGLQRRWREHGEPLAIVSCDNVPRNGEHTRGLVLELAALLPEPDAADLHAWIERSIGFPSTMVDRIVPATRPEHRARAAELLGRHDAAPVTAEPFSMWVLEDRFPAGRPRWEVAGAVFSDEVERYEQLKLRLLNATHSLVAYLGLLAGDRAIAGAIARPEIRAAAEYVIDADLRPTLEAPDGVDVPRYVDALFARFANAALDHRTCQVASDGSAKLPARITAAVLHHTARGAVPRGLALTVAAYVRCLATPESYDAAALGAVTDPRGGELAALGRRAGGSRELVAAVFELGIFAPAVAEAEAFVEAVAELHAVLVAHGPRAAIEAAIR